MTRIPYTAQSTATPMMQNLKFTPRLLPMRSLDIIPEKNTVNPFRNEATSSWIRRWYEKSKTQKTILKVKRNWGANESPFLAWTAITYTQTPKFCILITEDARHLAGIPYMLLKTRSGGRFSTAAKDHSMKGERFGVQRLERFWD